MSRNGRRRQQRARVVVELVRAGIGTLHLARAAQSGSGATARPGGGARLTNAVLGARQLTQAALVLRAGSADAHTVSAAVDAAHATTMVPLLVGGRRVARFGRGQLLVALGLAVAEIALVGRGQR